MKLRRWAIFEVNEEFKAGGMYDFVAAFDTEKGAEAYLLRNPANYSLEIADMWKYLGVPE